MLFHSPAFAVFFGCFLLGLLAFRGRARMVYTTLCSYFFYAWWYPPYLVILLLMTALAYGCGFIVQKSRRHLIAAVAITLSPLLFVKYSTFLASNILLLFGGHLSLVPSWHLPLGLSFITFTIIAYLVEVHRGTYPIEKKPDTVALYIAFFPHLIAGPILRPRELMPKLINIGLRRDKLVFAAVLFSVGMLKKVVFADQIAAAVDTIYKSPDPLSLGQTLLAFYGFTAQIYCDFSGYTDMAIAIAAFIGVRFPRNFERPYLSSSIREFWRRWHMSLSHWLRDYLYKPLGGSRHGRNRMMFAAMTTMALGGLWHGANWTFLLWGVIHGTLVVIEHLALNMPSLPKPPKWMKHFLTFHLVGLAWIVFRAPSLDVAGRILAGFFNPGGIGELAVAFWPCILIATVFLLHRWDSIAYVRLIAHRLPASITLPACVAGLAAAAALSIDNPNAFIYFDF